MPLEIQPKAAPPGEKSWWMQYGALGTVCALVIGVYAYSAHSGYLQSVSVNAADSCYNLLVQGFRAGHLSVKKEVPPEFAQLADPYDPIANARFKFTYNMLDLSYYKGRFYLYFGVTPALILFWPFVALTGQCLPHKDAVVIFCATGFLVSVGLLGALWRRYFAEVSVAVVAACALALGFGTGVPLLLSRSEVYEVAISCGYMLTMLALAAIWCALHEPERRFGWLAAGSVAYGLAVGARPNLLFGAVILLVPVVQAWRERRPEGLPRFTWLWGLMAATIPITLIGLGLMLYNFLRFDNAFEFGQHYQLSGGQQVTLQFFSLDYLWVNFRLYFLEPARWSAHFPFVHRISALPLPAGQHSVDKPFGVLTNIPVVWLALAVPLAWWNRPGPAGTILRWFVTAVTLLFGICALTLGFFLGAVYRYEVDFLPALLLLAVVGIFGLERVLAGRPAWRRAVRWGWGLLLGFSLAFNLLACVENYAEAHLYMGNALSRAGKLQDAAGQFEQALRIMPDYAEAQSNLGLVFGRAGKLQDAIRHYEEALRINPNLATTYNNLGLVLERMGKLQEAIGHYEQALRIDPNLTEAHYNLGNALLRAGKLRDAVGHYEQALRVDPDFAEAHNSLGLALWGAGKSQDAIGHYEQALRVNPDFAEAHSNLGVVLERVGKLQDAIGHYEEALRIKPGYVQAQNSLAWILATDRDDGVRNPAKAVQLAERACGLTGRLDPNLLDTLAAAYAAQSRFSDAIRTAQEALSLAEATGRDRLTNGIQNRLELYKVGRPYYERPVVIEPAE